MSDKRNAYWVLVGPIPKEVLLFEVLGVDGRMLLKWFLEGVDWILLAQDRDKWRGPVNRVMNMRIPYKCKHFVTS